MGRREGKEEEEGGEKKKDERVLIKTRSKERQFKRAKRFLPLVSKHL